MFFVKNIEKNDYIMRVFAHTDLTNLVYCDIIKYNYPYF